MCVYVYICMYICIYVYIYVYIHTYICIHTRGSVWFVCEVVLGMLGYVHMGVSGCVDVGGVLVVSGVGMNGSVCGSVLLCVQANVYVWRVFWFVRGISSECVGGCQCMSVG